MNIETRQVSSPAETRTFSTAQLRESYLLQSLFQTGEINMTYSHLDRTVMGGAVPTEAALSLQSSKQIGTDQFLDRREIGIFNIGAGGTVVADNVSYGLEGMDCLYLPMGTKNVSFESNDHADPARFYFVSSPAHHAYAAKKITAADANRLELGTQSDANVRVLRQYIHPDICDSCQLVMGMTMIEDGSIWNTMPCHTHERRSEIYLYFDMKEDTRVFHFMGEPDETRHLVVSNEQVVLSPGWSIHTGAGTGRYGFIWSMAGDNQDFTDMDFMEMGALR